MTELNQAVKGDAAKTHQTEAVDWRATDRALRRLARRRAAFDTEEVLLLRRARSAAVHVHLGYPTFLTYVERVLGYAPNAARERLRLAAALEALPLTRAAMGDGKIAYSAVRELSRVMTTETEGTWLAAVDTKTVREIEDLVRGRRPGDLPGVPTVAVSRPQRLRVEVSPATAELYLAARRLLEAKSGRALSEDELVAELCRVVLQGAAPVAPAAAGVLGASANGGGSGADHPAGSEHRASTEPAADGGDAPSIDSPRDGGNSSDELAAPVPPATRSADSAPSPVVERPRPNRPAAAPRGRSAEKGGRRRVGLGQARRASARGPGRTPRPRSSPARPGTLRSAAAPPTERARGKRAFRGRARTAQGKGRAGRTERIARGRPSSPRTRTAG